MKHIIFAIILLLCGCNTIPKVYFDYPKENVKFEQFEYASDRIYCAELIIKTEPRDALVYINKRKIELSTPVHRLFVLNREEDYEIILFKEGYHAYKQTIKLNRMDIANLKIKLIKKSEQ